MAGQKTKKQKYIITPDMHERIEAVYKQYTGKGQVNVLAKALKLPRWKVSRYAMSQGWIAKQKKVRPWTDEEREQLQKLARYTTPVIQRKMAEKGYKRTEVAIVMQLKRGKMVKNLDGHSARDVAECLGVDDHFVLNAIKAGDLKAGRRGTARTERQGGDHWYIRDRDIKNYIIENLHKIDIRKVDKYWFMDMITNDI